MNNNSESCHVCGGAVKVRISPTGRACIAYCSKCEELGHSRETYEEALASWNRQQKAAKEWQNWKWWAKQ